MSHTDYVEAGRLTGRKPGRLTDAPWDPQLIKAMRHHGVAVSEEQVAAQLLTELQDENASCPDF